MEYRIGSGQWMWHDLDTSNNNNTEELMNKYPACKEWLDNALNSKTNNIRMNTDKQGEEALWGSLLSLQDSEEKDKKQIFHFYLTREYLITVDLQLYDDAHNKDIRKKIHQAVTPVGGLSFILGEIVASFLQKIDTFEELLEDLIWAVKEKNKTAILDKIARSKHELLIWKNLIIPFLELRMSFEEAFGEEVREGPMFKRACKRIERARMLIGEYEEELAALVNLEEIVSSHRGNEIMKTLTVITTLFTPITVWGAVWGMNFKVMPELKWQFGYLFSWGIIGLTTVLLYIYLKKKGWMGDVLSVRKKNSFFK